jgi:spore coat polysaccharide biosynthesis protein SpsF
MERVVNVVAIVQARMRSSRLPGKVLADVAGIPMLFRVIDRTAAAETVNAVIVATTTGSEDDALADAIAARCACDVFRGSVDDVLSRYHDCAVVHRADVVVRVTADDPLKDPGVIDRAVRLLLNDPELDYCSNTLTPTFPEGLDIEAVRFDALARAHREAALPSEREHVTPYIWKNPEKFRVKNFVCERDLSDWRWTVDHPSDLDFVRRVYMQFCDAPLVPFEHVVEWLDHHPEIRSITAGIVRNEGYAKSTAGEA